MPEKQPGENVMMRIYALAAFALGVAGPALAAGPSDIAARTEIYDIRTLTLSDLGTALRKGLADGRIGRYVSDFPEADLLGDPRVISLPHLGASTGEAEENCALMVVDQLRDFLEHGNVRNSVNFPETRMARTGNARICIANSNRPNMIGQLSHVLGEAGVNIAQMHNASRGELAYSLIDADSPVPDTLVAQIAAIDGILSVRVIGS